MPVPSPGLQDSQAAPTIDASDASVSEKPWLSRKEWVTGVIRDNVGLHLEVYVVGVLGVAFLGASFIFLNDLPHLVRQGRYGPLIPGLILGPLGAGFTLRAIHLVLRWLKYGGSQLRLEKVPIPLGGILRAELTMSRRMRAGRPVRVKLQCVSAVVKQGIPLTGALPRAEDRSTEYSVIWEDEDTLQSDGSGKLQVAFSVPADGSNTTKPNGRDWRFWQLVAEEPGGRAKAYHAEFELPVFHTALAAGEAAAAASIVEERQRKLEAYKPGPGLKVQIRPAPEGGTEFLFPAVRSRGGAISQSVVFLLLLILIAATYGIVPIILTIVLGGVDLLLYIWLLRLWFVPERVVIGNGEVRATSGLFRITQTMPIDQVKVIHAVPITPPWLVNVRIKGQGWHQIGVGQGIRESRDAEWVALQMSKAAGVQAASPIPGNEAAEEVELVTDFVKEVAPEGLQGGLDVGLLGNRVAEAIKRAHANDKNE